MKVLHLTLLGKPQARLDDEPLVFQTAKAEVLLYYLAVTGQPQPRASLVELLWGEMPEAKARRNLTATLTSLRKHLAPYLVVETDKVAFNQVAPHRLDVALFLNQIEVSRESGEVTPLQEAVALYRGDFLEGLTVKKALSFEEWALTQRERLREAIIEALDRLVAEALNRGEHSLGIEHGRRLLALEPWRESAHRQMMLLLARNRQREAALAQYETCRQVLADELGVEPMAETTALYERLRAAGQPPPHNLPPPPNTFVGREAELAHIANQLGNPDCRLLTLIGPGGIGKTRLALEAARACTRPERTILEPGFHDGVHFVSLASIGFADRVGLPHPLTSTDGVASAIAGALDFSFQGSVDLLGQLLTYLSTKALLLVLDNFEHLLTPSMKRSVGLDVVVTLLQGAPALKLLVTSRERLNLQEEWVVEVAGLDYPGQASEGDGQLSDVNDPSLTTHYQQYSAVTLFVQRAQQVEASFSLTEMDAPHVIRLCQLVEGMPLGLELAASWLRILSSQEIVTEVEQSLDSLEIPWWNVPKRHRSLRAVFDQSWHMLTPPERAVFAKLSIFRGGFERDAARYVASASLAMLAGLVDKSLLRRSHSGRYDVHELLRQYATEKLWSDDDDDSHSPEVWQRHSHYYLEFVYRREVQLHSDAPQQALVEIRRDIDNIRHAWQWAVSQAEIELLNQSLAGLSRFYDLAGLLQEGEEAFQAAAAHLQTQVDILDDSIRPAAQATIVKLLTEQARLLNRRGFSGRSIRVMAEATAQAGQVQDIGLRAVAYHQWGESLCYHGESDSAKTQLEKALALARRAGLRSIEAEALRHLGIAVLDQGDYDRASTLYQQALTCFRQIGDRRGENLTLTNLGVLVGKQGAYPEAQRLHEQALQGFREINYQWGQGVVLDNLGTVLYEQGDYSEAQRLLTEGLTICREIRDRWGEGYLLNSLGNVARAQGDYVMAHSYYQQALELRREIKARHDEAYTMAELALLLHQIGDHRAAMEYSHQAENMGRELNMPTLRALALTHLGHAQVALGLTDEALQTYEQALQIRDDLGEHQALETRAGLVRAYLTGQRLEQAQTHTEELLPALAEEALFGLRTTFRVYLTCYQVLQANQDPRATDVLATAHRRLQERAAKVEDDRLRHSFLDKVPAHRELVQEFQKVRPIRG